MSEQPADVGEERLPPAPWLAQADGQAPESWAAEGPHPGPSWSSVRSPDGSAPRSAFATEVLRRPEVKLAIAFAGGVIAALMLKRFAE